LTSVDLFQEWLRFCVDMFLTVARARNTLSIADHFAGLAPDALHALENVASQSLQRDWLADRSPG
jgi:hypothetical protein